MRQYRNANSAQSLGFELQASGQITSRLKADASMALQSPLLEHAAAMEVDSPRRVGKLLIDGWLWGDRLSASGALQYSSERRTFTGGLVPAAYLVNFILATRRIARGLEVEFIVRNLLNARYWDPSGEGHSTDRIEQDGRSFSVRLSWGITAGRHEKSALSSLPGQRSGAGTAARERE